MVRITKNGIHICDERVSFWKDPLMYLHFRINTKLSSTLKKRYKPIAWILYKINYLCNKPQLLFTDEDWEEFGMEMQAEMWEDENDYRSDFIDSEIYYEEYY